MRPLSTVIVAILSDMDNWIVFYTCSLSEKPYSFRYRNNYNYNITALQYKIQTNQSLSAKNYKSETQYNRWNNNKNKNSNLLKNTLVASKLIPLHLKSAYIFCLPLFTNFHLTNACLLCFAKVTWLRNWSPLMNINLVIAVPPDTKNFFTSPPYVY